MYYTTARHFITRTFYWFQLNTGYWFNGLFDTGNTLLASLIYTPYWPALPIASLQNSRRICCWSCYGSSPGWWCQVRWWWSKCLLQHSSVAEVRKQPMQQRKPDKSVTDVPANVLTWGWRGGTSAHKGFLFTMITETELWERKSWPQTYSTSDNTSAVLYQHCVVKCINLAFKVFPHLCHL